MLPKCLDSRAVAVAEGGIPETTALLAQQWDLIFFTGSPPVGRIVPHAAAKNLTRPFWSSPARTPRSFTPQPS